jgi:CheY-like chemotaxis protein
MEMPQLHETDGQPYDRRRPPPCILLVEDDSSDVRLAERAIASARIVNPVKRVARLSEALAYLEAAASRDAPHEFPRPAVVITDLDIAGASGIDLVRWIRASDTYAGIPILMLTGSSQPGDQEIALAAGVTTFLVKSPRADALVRALVETTLRLRIEAPADVDW